MRRSKTERERIVSRMKQISIDIANVDKLLSLTMNAADCGHLVKRRQVLYRMYLDLNRELVHLDGVHQLSLFDDDLGENKNEH